MGLSYQEREGSQPLCEPRELIPASPALLAAFIALYHEEGEWPMICAIWGLIAVATARGPPDYRQGSVETR